MKSTNHSDNAEMQNKYGEILKNLQAREQALKTIVESLGLNLSNFSKEVLRKTEDASEILAKQGISEVNTENILLSHIRKTLKNDDDLSIKSTLVLQNAEIENNQITCWELSSNYNKAIKTYKDGIKKVSEVLNDKVCSTLLSPEHKAKPKFSSEQRILARRASELCEKLYEQKMRANELDKKLSPFQGLPVDVESAKHQVYLKKRQLEEMAHIMEDQSFTY